VDPRYNYTAADGLSYGFLLYLFDHEYVSTNDSLMDQLNYSY